MRLCLAVIALCCSLTATAQQTGSLVIAGGALSSQSLEVFDTFAELAGGESASIGVIPAATSSVNKQYAILQQVFARQGVDPKRVVLLPIAVKDDDDTEVDESQWADNSRDTALAAQVREMDAIWFVGGDQTLITKALLTDDGADTAVLEAIRSVYENGGTVGGTSAGAAIMSSIMIAGGNSQGAIFSGFKQDFSSMNEQEYGPVVTSKGLNFFSSGIIDQHFDRKARLGRLIVTLLNSEYSLGFGVDEGTAMVVSGSAFKVIGQSGVTLVDTRNVQDFNKEAYPVAARNIRLTFIQSGDMYNVDTGTYYPREEASSVVGNEYFNVPAQHVAGILNANRDLDQFMGYNLLDNSATHVVNSWLRDDQGNEVTMVFSQDKDSQGYWSQDLTADVYSFSGVRMDLIPQAQRN